MQTDRYAQYLQRERLRVIVLGPGDAQPDDLRKRRQIADRLKGLGYSLAMLGEDLLGDTPMPLHLALLSELHNIDLLLVLNTGLAPLAELTALSANYRAKQITRVWSKREYAQGSRSTPGDVLSMFDYWPFSDEEFKSCELVESTLSAAERFCLSKAQMEGRLTPLGLFPPS